MDVHLMVRELTKSIVLFFATLFPIVNPLGSAVIFLSLTRGYTADIRSVLVRRITFNSFILLGVSIFIGSHVLQFFGVSIPVVQVAGGLVLSATGWTLLRQKDTEPRPQSLNPDTIVQQAFYPLTLPITVGPGSISVAITLGADFSHQIHLWPVVFSLSALLGPLLVAASVYLCYRSAEKLERFLGVVGLSVFLRLSAFLVVCIGVQIMWNGISELIRQVS